jgi:hypothetical protein
MHPSHRAAHGAKAIIERLHQVFESFRAAISINAPFQFAVGGLPTSMPVAQRLATMLEGIIALMACSAYRIRYREIANR